MAKIYLRLKKKKIIWCEIIRLLVHYLRIVKVYNNQSLSCCKKPFTIKLILYKLRFKLYPIVGIKAQNSVLGFAWGHRQVWECPRT